MFNTTSVGKKPYVVKTGKELRNALFAERLNEVLRMKREGKAQKS